MASRRAPLHPLLRLIYFLFRVIAAVGLYVFYRRRIIIGKENLRFETPAIIVVNHPSTMMDVLNVCLHVRQESFFLANYGMFKSPLGNWLFSRLYCIPVKRRQDVAEGEARNNDAAFEKSWQHMEKGGLLFIAAEGSSWMDRLVRSFKPGAARIALGAEERNQWQLGVKILPVGLSYSAPNLFRSEVVVQYGAPVEAGEWQQAFAADPEKAIGDFTQVLEEKVRALVLHTHTLEKQPYVEQLETLMRQKFPKNRKEYFHFRKNLIEQNIDNEGLMQETADYFSALQQAGLSDEGLSAPKNRQGQRLAMLIAGVPLFFAGGLFWWLPCYLPALLAKKMKLYIGFDGIVKMLAGFFTFPLALWGAYRLARWAGATAWQGWAVLAALALAGYFLEWYQGKWRQFQAVRCVKQAPIQVRQYSLEQREAIIGKIIA